MKRGAGPYALSSSGGSGNGAVGAPLAQFF